MNQQLIRKTTPANLAIKSLDQEGWFEGYASTFGNSDLVGDTFQKGAFKRTLAHKGGKVPILLNHVKEIIVGYNYEAREDDHGLWVRGKLNLNTDAGKTAHFLLMSAQEAGGDGGLSIGFTVPSGGSEKKKSEPGFIFKECALKEYSVTPWACNPEALVTSVKNHEELPQQTKTMMLPAISIEQALKASQGEDANLTPEQLAGLSAFSDLISSTKSEPTATETPKEPPVAQTQTKEAATGPITFEAALANQKSEEPERLRIESALHASLDSILDANVGKGEQKVLIHKAQHCYADAVSDWTAKQLDSTDEALGKVLAIKGMSTGDHVDQQRRMAKARVHLDESSAQRSSSDAHAAKAHKYMHEAIQAYSAADIQAPNGPAVGHGKKSEELELNTKSEEFDLTALMTALAVPR